MPFGLSESRIREAVALNGVEALVVACPKAVAMCQDAGKTTGYESKLKEFSFGGLFCCNV